METGLNDVFAENDEGDDDEAPLVVASPTNTAPVIRDASFLVSTFNLANCAVGAGVLSVPYAVSELGVVLALVVLPAVAAVVVFTLHVLIDAADVYGAVSYQELVSKALGPGVAHFVSFTLILYIAGSCVAYTIIVADAFASVAAVAGVTGSVPGAFGVERTVVILVTSVCVLLPLSLLRRTKHLAPSSTVTIVALMYMCFAVLVEFVKDFSSSMSDDWSDVSADGNYTGNDNGTGTWNNSTARRGEGNISLHTRDRGSVGSVTFAGRVIDLWRFDANAVLALPIFVFAFQCHIQILSIYAELRDEPESDDGDTREETLVVGDEETDRPLSAGRGDSAVNRVSHATDKKQNRRQQSMRRVATVATAVCLVGYLLVGVCCFLNHPDVNSNMLKSYDCKDKYMLVATVGMGLSAIGSYPMNQFSARAALDDLLAAFLGWRKASPGLAPIKRHVLQTLIFITCTTATALRIEDLGKVFQLVGSTAGVLVICVVPAALLMMEKPKVVPVASRGDSEGESRGDRNGNGSGEDDFVITARGRSRRNRHTRSNHWTDGGGSIGGLHDLVGTNGGVEDMSGSNTLTEALLSPDTDATAETAESAIRKAQKTKDTYRGVALILLGLLIATSNVYVLFFNHQDEDVTGEDPGDPA